MRPSYCFRRNRPTSEPLQPPPQMSFADGGGQEQDGESGDDMDSDNLDLLQKPRDVLGAFCDGSEMFRLKNVTVVVERVVMVLFRGVTILLFLHQPNDTRRHSRRQRGDSRNIDTTINKKKQRNATT